MSPDKLKYPPITLGSLGEALNREDIDAISQRFKNLHCAQIDRVQQSLLSSQQCFINLLPVIFHINCPLLPGFISHHVPAGISGYQPSKLTIDSAQQFDSSFKCSAYPVDAYSIYGVYLMGSVSSIAFSTASDIDVWICHQAGLATEAFYLLEQKAIAVEKWAQTLALEVHIFLVEEDAFRQGNGTPISTESSGATQHYLLLEEFYRTAVFVAGRIPVWWIVPPQEELNYVAYVQYLKDKQVIMAQEVIDFGGFESVPVEEFIGATLWHLYKAINSPYKSLLKLMLMECYASEYPHPQWLCFDLKKSIYQGDCDLDERDPYLQLYQKIEYYLEPFHDQDRLNLVRQSFYIKIMGPANAVSENSINQQRYALVKAMAEKWAWSDQTYTNLIQRENWNIENAVAMHNSILQQLNYCYRTISGFAGQYIAKKYQEHEDIKIIGRKLYTLLDRKPGKIEAISTRAIIYRKETELSIFEIPFASNNQGWALYLGHYDRVQDIAYEPIKKAWSLIEILAWLVINDFYHNQGKIHFYAESRKISTEDLQLMVTDLRSFLQAGLKVESTSLDVYKHANKLTASMLIVNLGLTFPEPSQQAMMADDERASVFSYGIDRQNFIVSTERLSFSNWGEVISHRYEGVDGLFSCLVELVNSHQAVKISPLEVCCYTSAWASDIISQIKSLYQKLVGLATDSNDQEAPRYIIAGENAYYLFQMSNGQLSFIKIASEIELIAELGKVQITFSPIVLADNVLRNNTIPSILPFNYSQTIQIFFDSRGAEVDVYILDEKGSLFIQSHQGSKLNHLLTAYSMFLKTLINRGALEQVQAIEYFEIYKNAKGTVECKRVEQSSIPTNLYFDLRIAGKELSSGHIIYTIICNGLEFSTMEHGTHVFQSTADYVISQRKDHQSYPIHITDMDMPLSVLGINRPEDKQAIQYLYHKKHIEELFNG